MHISDKTSPVNMYGIGFGNLTAPFLGSWGTFIALTILNAFILTTLDSATRITRYIAEELFGIKNRYVLTLAIVMVAGWLALGKDSHNTPIWQIIWPAFGASNQLVAALALLVVSCWLLSKDKPIRYSIIPSFFMLATSLTALVFQLITYWQERQYALIVVSLVLITSALVLSWEVFWMFVRKFRNPSQKVEPAH